MDRKRRNYGYASTAIKNKDGTITHRKMTPEEQKASRKRALELSIKLNPSDFDLKTGKRLTDEDKMKRRMEARKKASERINKRNFKKGGMVNSKAIAKKYFKGFF